MSEAEASPCDPHKVVGCMGCRYGTGPHADPLPRYVIYSDDAGVYIGSCLGLGFWSKWDAVGQEYVVTFESIEVAERAIATWDTPPPGNWRIVPIALTEPIEHCDGVPYASIEDVKRAGLPGWTP